MPIFKYNALTDAGEAISSTITSVDRSHAESELLDQGLFITSITGTGTLFTLNRGLTLKQQLIFVKSLVSLIKSGLPLRDGLIAIEEQADHERIRHYTKGLISAINKGDSLAEACKMYPEAFSHVFVCTIEVGEKTGELGNSLEGLQNHLVRQLNLSKKVKSALTYPVFLLVTLLAVVTLLFIYVVPSFAELFSSFDTELPTPTKIVLAIADAFPLIAACFLAVFFTLAGLKVKFGDNAKYKLFLDNLTLKIPLLGSLVTKSQAVTITTTLGSLLESGASITESLDICSRSMKDTQQGRRLAYALEAIVNGGSLAQALEKHRVLTGYTSKILAVGEKSSNVEQSLKDVSNFLQDELDEFVTRLTALLEPSLILVMGVLMGFIIISMYLPVFFISEVVQ